MIYRFLEQQAVLVFDGNKERVLGVVIPAIASAVVLDLDDERPKLAYFLVH